MIKIIEIKTDKSVFDFVFIFMKKDDIEIIGEFDSANYGVGYNIKVKNAECRLFDDLDSRDENEPRLYIEIDRNDILNSNEQLDTIKYLKNIIKEQDFKII